MAKKRKTRKEKELADLRAKEHTATSEQSSQHVYQFSSIDHASTTATSQTTPATHYEFLRKDLTKTLIVMGSIIAAQLVLFFLMKTS